MGGGPSNVEVCKEKFYLVVKIIRDASHFSPFCFFNMENQNRVRTKVSLKLIGAAALSVVTGSVLVLLREQDEEQLREEGILPAEAA